MLQYRKRNFNACNSLYTDNSASLFETSQLHINGGVSSLPFSLQCVNKEVADINIPSHSFMPQNKLTGTECGFLGLVPGKALNTNTLASTLSWCTLNALLCSE